MAAPELNFIDRFRMPLVRIAARLAARRQESSNSRGVHHDDPGVRRRGARPPASGTATGTHLTVMGTYAGPPRKWWPSWSRPISS